VAGSLPNSVPFVIETAIGITHNIRLRAVRVTLKRHHRQAWVFKWVEQNLKKVIIGKAKVAPHVLHL